MGTHTLSTRNRLTSLAALLMLPFAKAASPAAARPRWRTITRTYRNALGITVPVTAPSSAPVSAGLYPTTIVVSGLRNGRILDVNLRLFGLSHYFPGDLEVLLVGPRGQTAVIMGNIGGAGDVSGVTLWLDDEAAVPLPGDPGEANPLTSGRYRPANNGNDIDFNTPAPPAGRNVALSVFDGTNPNGTWRLFVQNQFGTKLPVGFTGGWALELNVQVRTRRRRARRTPRRS